MISFAAPLFSDAEKAFNASLTADLEDAGHSVFLPQRDGAAAHKHPYSSMTPDDRRPAASELDRDRITACDVFLFVLDGRAPDEGVCVELGSAYGHRFAAQFKRLVSGLHTDCRAAFPGSRLDPMLLGAFDVIVEDRRGLLETVQGGAPQ